MMSAVFCMFDSMPSAMCLHMRGGCSGGVIFHVNRGRQDVAVLLFVKSAVPHICTRSAVQTA